MNYSVRIKTGDLKSSGTDHTAKIQIVGEKGETEYHVLTSDKWFVDDNERSDERVYHFKDIDVGSLALIHLR